MWYQTEANTGMFRIEGAGGSYMEVSDRVWVPWVHEVIKRYRRVVL